LQKLHLIETA